VPVAFGRQSRITAAVAAAGFAVFALLYAPQAVLPQLAAQFGLRPAGASLAVSVATGALAVAVLPVTVLSEVVGRRPVMLGSVLTAAVLGVAAPFAPSFSALIALRALQGLAVAGVPAVAMAYLADEVDAGGLGAAMGALIAGNSAGGMFGRLVSGVTGGWFGWRGGFAAVGVLGVLCAGIVALTLPASRRQRPAPGGTRSVLIGLWAAMADPVLLGAYVVAALAMGSFVAIYNVIGFRVAAPPLALSPAVAALLFLAYAAGGVSSTRAGRLADRFGRPRVLLGALALTTAGTALTLPAVLPTVLVGLVVLTGGFFATHAVASGWVGARAPSFARGHASGMYLLAYYLGSSVGGTVGSAAYGSWGWAGFVGLTCAWFGLAAVAVVITVVLTAKTTTSTTAASATSVSRSRTTSV
jgi:MFS transporter, YNFM family, putative membrane transport protein